MSQYIEHDQAEQAQQEANKLANDTVGQGTKRLAGNAAKRAGGRAMVAGGKALRSGGKMAVKAIGTFLKAVTKLIKAMLIPWGVAVIAAIILFAALFDFAYEERGTSTSLDLYPQNENPTVTEDGYVKAVAMTETQALIDAYYKYLACGSYSKIYVDDSGAVHALRFDDVSQAADFAGLEDVNDKENYFYLSPYFIKMTDELLNEEDFYYPEQVVKSVYYDVLPLEDPNDDQVGKKYVTTLPLTDDGSQNAKAILSQLSDEIDDLPGPYASATEVSAASSIGELPKRTTSSDATGALLVQSDQYVEGQKYVTDGAGNYVLDADGNYETKSVFTQADDDPTAGIWDYGFGSVLQYEPMEKDVTMDVSSVSIAYHFHVIHWTYVVPEDSTGIGTWVQSSVSCHDAIYDIPSGATASSIIAAVDNFLTSTYAQDPDIATDVYTTVEKIGFPSAESLSTMCSNMTDVKMKVLPGDEALAGTWFEDPTFRDVFGNVKEADYDSSVKKTRYPLTIPVISAAATFSGNIRYEYDMTTYSRELTDQTIQASSISEDVWLDDCTSIELPAVTCTFNADGTPANTVHTTITRAGTVTTTEPSIFATEYTDPFGSKYIEDYGAHYSIWVPDTVQSDLYFKERISQEMAGTESLTDDQKDQYDADADGKVTTMDMLIKMGFLTPYSGGTLGQIGMISQGEISAADQQTMEDMGCGTDEEGQVRLLAKVIAAEAGPNKLDQLMVASVVVNRVYSDEFSYADSIIEVISAPGQYSTWPDTIQSIEPTEEMLSSARQVLSGQFSIPANIVFQAGFTQGSYTWLVNQNGAGFNTHYYCSNDAPDTMDVFGRVAYNEQQARDRAEELHQEDVSAGISTGESASNIVPGSGYGSIVESIDGQQLYAIKGFDMQTALSSMRQLASRDEPLSWWESFLNAIGNALSAIAAWFQSTSVFQQASDNYMYFARPVDIDDVHNTVIQALTFSDQAAYSSVYDQYDPEALQFLFVGASGWGGAMQGTASGLGGVLTPGVGSVFEGFTSPTTSHYSISEAWSSATGSATYAIPAGTTLQSVGEMTVTDVDDTNGSVTMSGTTDDGKSIIITYQNLDEISVAVGSTLAKGDTVGTAGDGGVKISLSVDGENVDPAKYFYQPTYSTGASFMDVLTPDGEFDDAKIEQLLIAINTAVPRSGVGALQYYNMASKYVGECAWYAKGRGQQYITETNNFPSTPFKMSYGNGQDFAKNSEGQWVVDKTPSAGSWICWRGGAYGHVAFVEAVDKHGTILISHTGRTIWDNTDGKHPYGIELKKISSQNGNYICYNNMTLEGFIHLDQPL